MIVLLLFVIFRFYAVSIPPKTYSVLSGQYSRRLELAERRGFIYDRNGNRLVSNEYSYSLYLEAGSFPYLNSDKNVLLDLAFM